ncbi:MAG TPA: serine/threonine-protein kinase [Ramlibacter sp.]|nr:serine/threonine-protein kinase [Ramlibacter sp.]
MSLKKLGRYDLIRVLGKGAMGIVYEGRDPNLDRRVAIKTVKVENLSEEAAAEYEFRFRTEARSAARLQHPNIVSVYDSDRDGDIAFLVMEYIQGDDLKHHLDKGLRYSLEQSLKMIRDLLSALDYAHKQGIVHRDIKPANLLIEPGGRVKLTDFGVARIQDSGEATRTQGSMVGTLKYMSPEQVQGQKIDSRADLFSVGVVLYQLLTDKRPFDGDNDFSIIHQIIGHNPAPPSSFNARLPAAIDAVVARALAKNRDERFASARDFAAALQSAIRRAEDATVVPPADPTRKPDRTGTASRPMQSMPGSGTGGSTVTQEVELVYWKDIKDSTEPEEFESFLAKFPAGIYADLARRRLRKLTGTAIAGDQTVLSGTTLPGAEQDLEATRMRTGSTPLVVPTPTPAPPAADRPAGNDYTRTIVEDREGTAPPAEGSTTETSVPLMVALARKQAMSAAAAAAPVPAPPAAALPPVAVQASKPPAVPVPSPKPSAQAATPARKKAPVAVLAGLGAVGVVAIVAFIVMGRGGPSKTSVASVASSAASSTVAEAPPAAAAPVEAPVTPVAGAVASAPAAPLAGASAPGTKASAPAPKASAPRRVASAVKPKPVPSAPAVETVRVAPPPVTPREEAKPAPAPVASGPNPVEQCRDKIFISKELCLAEHCDKPGSRNHALCVQRRADIKLREESKVRQGPQ